jgi:hypothetical protein
MNEGVHPDAALAHSPPEMASATPTQSDRYAGVIRNSGAIVCGWIAGILLPGSLQVGVGFAVEGQGNPSGWTVLLWGDHWAWRAVASILATGGAAFLAGMVGRRAGGRLGLAAALPSALYWAAIAFVGWTGSPIVGIRLEEIPLGYKIVATVLALVTLPISASVGAAGSPYGHANAHHFDKRRRTLLGIRWYHFLWLPFLIHVMIITGTWGTVLAFGWMVTAWKNSLSLLAIIPTLFLVGMVFTLQLLVRGAFGTYQALAGFDDDTGHPAWKRVLKYGLGYTAGTAVLQSLVSVLYAGVANLLGKIFG